MASETDMRRHSALAPGAPGSSASDDDASQRASTSDRQNGAAGPVPASPTPPTPTPPMPPQPPADDASRQSQSAEHESTKHRRFSVLRFRNASDPQFSLRARQQAEKPPPVPMPPAIVTTAPTNDVAGPKKKTSRMSLAAKFRRSNDMSRNADSKPKTQSRWPPRKSFAEESGRPSLATLDEPQPSPPPQRSTSVSNGATLNVSSNRQSESSRSDASSTDRLLQPSPTTSLKRPQASASFKLRRPRKTPEPLFPLAHLSHKTATGGSSTSLGVDSTPRPASAQSATMPRARAHGSQDGLASQAAAAALARGNGPHSNYSSPTRATLLRGRSPTLSSTGRDSTDGHLVPPNARVSTPAGRKSFGDLFGLSRIRQNPEPGRQGSLTPATPGSITSKSNLLQLSRGSIMLPERHDDESPVKYLARLESVLSRGVMASALSRGADPSSAAVLRSYMRGFSFFGDPMDMAIRKLLMEAELPKETQQIDRCLQAFANRYHECNPGIYSSPDQAYFIAFSLLILHTDVFNKNNKYKMQKSDYLKNTRGEGIFDEILECFYDNISYTPFIHVEDDVDLSHKGAASSRSKKRLPLSASVGDTAKQAAKEPIDPYTLIMDGNLDALRPNLKDTMPLEEHYNYLGTATGLNLKDLQKTFFRTGVLQIVSAKSRPDAFMSERTATNSEDAHPGIVDIKITKVGLLWRKETKKRKTCSPWHEWGAMLTGAQLYFFRNTSWVKNLMHQYENHIKAGHDGIPIIFKPPLEEFKPDALMSTQGAVALVDTTYKKHKNALVYVRQGGLDEVLLADNEEERNDWLAKLNYATAFRTSGIRMRGVVGANYDGQGRRGIRRLDSSDATQLVQTPTGPVSIARGRIDHKMAQDIQAARRDGMQRKIAEADAKVDEAQRQLEEQLRNAHHLQILAPIQPRTREQLLLAAARMAAQLKWTRMEIWREKCHRDILVQDLADDRPASASTAAARKKPADGELASAPTPAARLEPKAKRHNIADTSPQTATEPFVARRMSNAAAADASHETEWPPSRRASQPPPPQPPQSAARPRRPSRHSASDLEITRHGSVSSAVSSAVPSSPAHSPTSTPRPPRAASPDGKGTTSSTRSNRSHDDVDADERDFLRQAGLWEARIDRSSADKATVSTSAESADLDRSRTRRSLQRTLRESAGHLSHHRGRKGKEAAVAGAPEEAPRDATLSRGTGSFVVHGKKASVINLGTELKRMSQDDKVLSNRKQQQHAEQPPPVSPAASGEPDDDFQSAHETRSESNDLGDRRESAASASATTARSFRDLHRGYSSSQAARSASGGGRLAVPSDDGESEAAVRFSDGRRSPLPCVDKGPGDEPEAQGPARGTPRSRRNGRRTREQTDEEGGNTDEESPPEPEHLSRRPVQAVNA